MDILIQNKECLKQIINSKLHKENEELTVLMRNGTLARDLHAESLFNVSDGQQKFFALRMSKKQYENTTQMSKMLPASNIYRVGDYVFVETQPNLPYQIRRIEELTKTSNGQVEAKVSCFYRRRDLSNALVSQADKHALSAEEENEINVGTDDLSDEQQHQLKHREVFLSRQLEIINANTIRGKCSVTLYSEVEKLVDYLCEDEWFYYLLVYDPQQKTLLADRGEIGVGDEYQADNLQKIAFVTLEKLPSGEVTATAFDDISKEEETVEKKEEIEDDRDCSQLETMQWDPNNPLSDKEINQYLVVARSVGTFARALDSGSSMKEPSLHLSAAAASRDITLFNALLVLHNCNYDIGKAVSALIPDGGPVLCRDEMEEWSAGEAALFEEGIRKNGKEFSEIQQEFLPWKSITNIIEYYYMWKTTDKYVQQKRMKAQDGDSKVTQIFIPSSNTAINLTLAIQATSQYQVAANGALVTPNYMCESCYGKESVLWYPWGQASSQCKLYLCKECWVYWKKCGGLKKSTKSSDASNETTETVYKCRICNKKFHRAERLSSHMVTHRGLECTEEGCDKTFALKTHLIRHLTKVHSISELDSKMNVKTSFFMTPTPLMKAARYLCKEKLRLLHFARSPAAVVDANLVKEEAAKHVTPEKAKATREREKKFTAKPLEQIVSNIKKLPKPFSLKLHSNSSSKDPSPEQRFSPGGRPSPSATSITQNLKAKTLKSPTPIGGHKRSAEPENNDYPPSKRQPPASSPLGRKGFECTFCGKLLHNQASLQHHIQVQHERGAPQIHIPQQQQQQQQQDSKHYQHYHDVPPTSHYYQHSNGPPHKQRPTVGTSRKQSYKGIQSNRRDPDTQYVDPPPQEFLFNATKDSKKSRRSLPPRVQRKIARKPFVQIKCSQELRDAIMCKKESDARQKDPIVIDDD